MANISALLEIIRTAHLGRDMRQALHDAIKTVNNDTENALGKSLTFATTTRKLSLKAKDGSTLSEVTIPGGSGSGSVNSVNNVQPDADGNVTVNLADINDVNLNSPSSGQVLKYDGEKWINGSGGSGGGAVDSVNGMTGDVVLTASDVGALADNTPIPSDLSDLSDVDTSGVTDGQILKYNGTSGKFLPSNESGGGTTDYTDLTNKPQINGVPLNGNKTSGDLDIFAPTITSPTSGQVIKYDGSKWINSSVSGGSNENLLDNAWFTVNQKGFSSKTYSSRVNTNDYILERWAVRGGGSYSRTYTLTNDGLNILVGHENPSTERYRETMVVQDISEDYVGKVMTASMLLSDGRIVKGTNTIASGTSTKFFEIKLNDVPTSVLAQTSIFNNHLWMRFEVLTDMNNYTSGEITATIKAVKLEYGSVSTLALDTEPNYTTELLKCQRYFYPLGGKSYNAMVSPLQQTRQWFTITLPTEMRAVPTLSGSLVSEGISGSSSMTNTVTSSNITVTKTQDIDFNFTTSGNYNLCSNARVSFASGSYLSAEL